MISFLYVIFAIFALSFLIFIHELGHYIMARRAGMRVETFSIGFGKPIFSWIRDGVKWQIGWLPLGGFVKIAGMSTESDEDPATVPDGFFAKTPWERLKVAAAGPFVNIVFAFFAFSLIWFFGGREKNFSEYTAKIGWVDPQSELYAQGIRPGDEVVAFDGNRFTGARDHLFVALAGNDQIAIEGNHIDYLNGEKTPFVETVHRYPHPNAPNSGLLTTGITGPASYVLYKRFANQGENPLPEGSPLENSGIEYGDRIFWVEGETIFSINHLLDVLNDQRALLTINRGKETLLRRVPRVQIQELRPEAEFKEEITDWAFDTGLTTPFHSLYMIPYNLSYDGSVEGQLHFLNPENEEEAFPKNLFTPLDAPLNIGDTIIAVDGKPVHHGNEILKELQEKQVQVIVERDPALSQTVDLAEAEREFIRPLDLEHVQNLAKGIGVDQKRETASGPFVLLNPITPKRRIEFLTTEEQKSEYLAAIKQREEEIAQLSNKEERLKAEHLLKKERDRVVLGFGAQDRPILFNPPPTTLFGSVFDEIWRTLSALLTGSLSPKWMGGPIAIVYSVQQQSMVSLIESLYWVGLISLNLGMLNLLPIPILDGGTIVFSILEIISGKRLKPQTMEKLIIPFAILLFAFFIYLTYNDIMRIFGNFLHW